MSIYIVQKRTEGLCASYHVCDAESGSVASCDQFLTGLSQRDCSVYTQRAYAIGLAHFFNWLNCSGVDLDHINSPSIMRQIPSGLEPPRVFCAVVRRPKPKFVFR
jgi:hypothetical protein